MPGSYDGSVRIDTRVDSKGFNKGISGMTAGLGKLAAAVGIAFGVGAIINFGRTAVQAASELASAMTGLKSILDGQGRSFAAAQAFIQEYTADGLVPATNAIVAYKNLALRGYDDSQIKMVMTALKDSAAFARTSSYTMGEAIQMATEGLKNENSILVDNAGVTKNVAMMWRDYAREIGTTAAALTQQQKIQAEVNGILQETRFQTGDAAKLSGGYAGMVAALGTSFYNLKVALGNAIIPILSQIIPYVKAVIDWFVILFNTVARVISLFFGVDAGMVSLEDSSSSVATNTETAASAAGDLADNTTDAQKAAKGALAAFDELNVLQMESETGGGGGATTPALVPSLGALGEAEAIDLIPDEWADDIANFKAALMDLLEPAITAFGVLKEALIPLGETIWSGLKWAWDNILVPLGEWVISDAVPAFLLLLAAGATVLNSVLTALKPLGLWLWESFLKPAAAWVGDAIIAGLTWLTDALYRLSDWISQNQTVVEIIAIVLGSIAAAIVLVNIALAVYNVVTGIAAAVTTLLASPILLVVLAIAAVIAVIVILVRHWDTVKEVAGRVWAWIVEKWGMLAAWFRESVTEPVVNLFRTAWEDITGFFRGAWDAITLVWGAVAAWFQEHIIDPIASAWETFTTALRTGWETVWGAIESVVKGVINTVIGFINGLISAILGAVNAIIRAINTLSFDIPEWVPVIGGQTFGFSIREISIPQIPYLASGAVIPPNAEFLAMLGDQRNGRNIEAPEALIRQIIQEEIGGQETAIQISFEGTLGALVRELQPHITREQRRTGKSLVGSMA